MAERCKVCGSETCRDHCVFCDRDITVLPHADDCPSTTGLFPVRPIDLGQECVHCHQRTPGMSCPGCGHVFEVGDFYVHRSDGEIEGIPVGLVMCVGCEAVGAEVAE